MNSKKIKRIKDIVKKLLPKSLIEKINAKRFPSSNPHKHLLIRNKILEDVGYGKRAFILATGTSIKDENLKLLQGEDCFSVSNFFLHKDINIIRPRLHFFAPHHEPLTLDSVIEWFRLADQKLPPETCMVLSTQSYNHVKQYNLFPRRNIFYLHPDQYHYAKNKVDITKAIIPPQTVVQMVYPTLFYMRYSKIYLLGCDHKSTGYFYPPSEDVRKTTSHTSNIFDKNIGHFECSKNLNMVYKFYNTIASSPSYNLSIINLTLNSTLELFPKQSLNQIMM